MRTLLSCCLVALASTAGLTRGNEQPNILLIFADNLGYGDLGCYGSKVAKTPNIDRLATEGVRCTSFYIASPSCSPSRGAILTGRHPLRNGLNHQLATQENAFGEGLPRTERLLPQYLRMLGYVSGAFGKWNIGFAPGSRPTERGFDEFLGHMSGNIHYFKYLYHGKNDLRRGIEPVDRSGTYSTDLFADAAIDFMKRHKHRPWFVYVPFNAVHFVGDHNVEPGEKVEWQVPAKYLALYGSEPGEKDQRRRFLATLTALDDAVGRVLSAVDDLALRQRTVVMFISDNGAFMLPGRGLEVQSNLPLRDGGVTTHEGGVRVPALFRWPGRFKAGTVCDEMLSSLDILPMMMSGAGGKLPADRVIDGLNPIATLAGESGSPHKALYWVWDQGRAQQWRAMREDKYKLIRRADKEPWQLYDLSRDLGETKNLAKEKPELVTAMADKLSRWQASILSDPTRGKPQGAKIAP